MMILSFNTEAESDEGAKRIWINYIRYYIDNGCIILDSNDSPVTDLTGYTDDQIYDLKICGNSGGVVQLTHGYTLRYAITIKAYQVAKWYISEPPAQFLTGVVGYTAQEFPDSWRYPSPA